MLGCLQGSKEPRLEGEEHMAAVEEFCMAAKRRYPNCLVQFEDFPTDKVRNQGLSPRHKPRP